MKNSQEIQDVTTELWSKLEEILRCDGLTFTNANDQLIANVNGREIQFIVHAPKDAKDTSFWVKIDAETEDPKEVIQAAKAFKSTYL